MSAKPNYFKLGLFIITGSLILVAALIILGLGGASQKTIKMETYFKESVQGIDIGTPVKFLGVRVGNITRISFAFVKYQDFASSHLRYVLVEFGIDPSSYYTGGENLDFEEIIKREVARGLRIKTAPQGLTGTAYLEMDYVDPAKNPPLPIDWQPASSYIPSAPSTIARLEETLRIFSDTLTKIRDAGIDTSVANLNGLITSARKAVEDARLGQISERVHKLIGSLDATNASLHAFLEGPDFNAGVKSFAASMGNIQRGTDSLPQAVEDTRRLIREVLDLLAEQRGEIRSILENTGQTMENVKDLTGDAKRNPARLFFGEPPARKEP